MADAPRDTFAGAGIAVSDLARSVDFYTRVMGMKQLMTFELPTMDEVVVGFAGAPAAIVLMHYTDGSNPNFHDNPGKLVFYVVDPVAVTERIRAEGHEIVRDPEPNPGFGDLLVGFARDPDGLILELIQT